jgi:hypothetical protein
MSTTVLFIINSRLAQKTLLLQPVKLHMWQKIFYCNLFAALNMLIRRCQRDTDPVKVNQKMAFFGFVQYQFELESEFWKAGFENLLLLLSNKKELLRHKFKLQVSLLSLVQNQRVKSAIAEKQNWKLKHCFSGGFIVRVSRLRFKTDIEKPNNGTYHLSILILQIWHANW